MISSGDLIGQRWP